MKAWYHFMAFFEELTLKMAQSYMSLTV